MKRYIAFLLIFVLLFTMLCGCDNTTPDFSSDNSINSNENYREHQELIATEADFDADNMMRFSIPEVGLENVYVEYVSGSERICGEGYGRVYLLADDPYGGGRFPSDLYLMVEFNDKIFVKDVSSVGYYYDINLCDVDGDTDVEIILNVCVGVTGGHGNHMSRVFDFKDNTIVEIFSSENGEYFDTGYSITILKDKKFIINNSITGYAEEFVDCRSNRDDKNHIYWWYNPETGEAKDISLWVDSFYEFLPTDVDQDGVYEITCRQYVCLVDHADGLGDAITVIKYNNDTSQFEIIDTKFECYN